MSEFLPTFIRDRLEGRRGLVEIVHNTGWMMGDQILRQVVGLLVGVWLARYLGPQLFGDYSYAFALVMMASPLAMLGLDEMGIRRMVQDPSSKDELLGTSFTLMLAGGILAFGVVLASVFWTRPEETTVHWLVGILGAGVVLQAFIAIEFWFESQMEWKFTALGKVWAFALANLAKVALILAKAPLVAFAWCGLAEAAIGAVGLLIVFRSRGHSVARWRFNPGTGRSLLADSWPFLFSAVLMTIYLRIDQVMLGSMVPSAELGNYSVAVRIAEAWYFIPGAICSSVFPAVMKAEGESEEFFYAHLQRLYGLMVLLAYAVALPVAFFSRQVIRTLFSDAYSDAGPLLAILVWTGVFTSLGVARNVFIVAKKWARLNLLSVGLGCLLNVLLNLALIPRYGARGAVIATFISYWFATHGTCLFFKPLRRTGWMMTKAMLCPKFW
ncbi:MAG: flippase [Deltaproteobacteria bacterium]|nr:flippase [Deltaproteobacteria bacterium]